LGPEAGEEAIGGCVVRNFDSWIRSARLASDAVKALRM